MAEEANVLCLWACITGETDYIAARTEEDARAVLDRDHGMMAWVFEGARFERVMGADLEKSTRDMDTFGVEAETLGELLAATDAPKLVATTAV